MVTIMMGMMVTKIMVTMGDDDDETMVMGMMVTRMTVAVGNDAHYQ